MLRRIQACLANRGGFTRYWLGLTMAVNFLCDPVFVLTFIQVNLSFTDSTRGFE